MPSTKRVMPVAMQLVSTPAPTETNKVIEFQPAQERPAKSEIRYQRLFEAGRDGILILNALTLKITDVNPFMIELLGYSRAELLGKELWEIGLFSDKGHSQSVFRKLQQTHYIRYEDLPLQTRHGERREVEFVSNVYHEGDQQVIQCNIRDNSEHKRTQEERRLGLEAALASARVAHAEADRANTIKDEFLAILSHELRTPLSAILGFSDLLSDGLDEKESKQAIEIIVRNARVQRRLIDDLLDTSRIITGKLRLNVRQAELAPIIEAVVDGLRPAADARNIHLQITLGPRTGAIAGDTDRLQQIVWNLLTNAIKFTPKGGRVEVRLDRNHSHIGITVSDTGQGIDPDLLPHVFERFRQSDSSTTRKHGGLGLGLSIVRQLVELHGGKVTAESPGTGEGATFKVILPVMSIHHELSDLETTRSPMVSQPRTDCQQSLNELRVLVVDDESDARKLVVAVLTGRGAEVVSVESAGKALEEMERQRFDVLVSDIGMPEMDGYALIEQVRKLPAERGGKIPAAALTAHAGVEDRVHVLSAGFQIHIPKPVEPAELSSIVASLAERFAVA
jgi:PAS domain S-box-containing protein